MGAVSAQTPEALVAETWRLGAGDVVAVTERLVLRRWREDDLEPFAALNADAEVMTHVASGPLDSAASDALAHRADAGFALHGHGLAALEERGSGRFVGFTGLAHHWRRPGQVEVGWRLARAAWGRGYASEAGRAQLALARAQGLPRVECYVAPDNARSLAVAQRLGLERQGRLDWDGQPVVLLATPPGWALTPSSPPPA